MRFKISGLNNSSGHILLQTLIILPILYIALFLPFHFAVAQHKRSVLNGVLENALQKAAVDGGLKDDIRADLLNQLHEQGFDAAEVVITPTGYSEVARPGMIRISISIPGNSATFRGVQALGGSKPPDDWRITAAGSIMSEKLP